MLDPVFIWGNGQSGTFLIFDSLAVIGRGRLGYIAIKGPRKKGFATDKYGKHEVPLGNAPLEGLGFYWGQSGLPWPHKEDGFHFFGTVGDEDVGKMNIEAVRQRYREVLTRTGIPLETGRILDKDPNYTLMVKAIDAAFPAARHIFCVRDPRAVLSSILRRFKDPGYEPNFKGYPSGFYSNIFPPGYEQYAGTPLDVRHAWQIQQVMEIGFAAAKALGPRCHIHYHERFCSEPEAEIGEVEQFLGFPGQRDEPVRKVIEALKPVSERRWPTSAADADACRAAFLDGETIADIQFLRDYAQSLGYDPEWMGRRTAAAAKSAV